MSFIGFISQSWPGVISIYQTGLAPFFRAVIFVKAKPNGQSRILLFGISQVKQLMCASGVSLNDTHFCESMSLLLVTDPPAGPNGLLASITCFRRMRFRLALAERPSSVLRVRCTTKVERSFRRAKRSEMLFCIAMSKSGFAIMAILTTLIAACGI